jgi:hypothetical protein
VEVPVVVTTVDSVFVVMYSLPAVVNSEYWLFMAYPAPAELPAGAVE